MISFVVDVTVLSFVLIFTAQDKEEKQNSLLIYINLSKINQYNFTWRALLILSLE